MSDITTPAQQQQALREQAANDLVRSLDASNVNLESGTGKVPVKSSATEEEIAEVKAVTGHDVIVGPLATQDPIAAQVDIVADAQKAADDTRAAGSGLPADHESPESPAAPAAPVAEAPAETPAP